MIFEEIRNKKTEIYIEDIKRELKNKIENTKNTIEILEGTKRIKTKNGTDFKRIEKNFTNCTKQDRRLLFGPSIKKEIIYTAGEELSADEVETILKTRLKNEKIHLQDLKVQYEKAEETISMIAKKFYEVIDFYNSTTADMKDFKSICKECIRDIIRYI